MGAVNDPAAQVAEVMANLLHLTAPVREAVAGYRRSMLDAEVGEFAADQMAVEFHQLVMARIAKSLGLTP